MIRATSMAIRVVAADDNPLMREGVRQALSLQPGLELVAVCDDFPSLLQAVEESRPDVVLTDIRMPPTNTDEGIRAAERIRQLNPATGVLVLSQYVEAE